MMKDYDMMRVMADEYRRMAEEQTDPKERSKFLSYASVHDELARRKHKEEQFQSVLKAAGRDPGECVERDPLRGLESAGEVVGA